MTATLTPVPVSGEPSAPVRVAAASRAAGRGVGGLLEEARSAALRPRRTSLRGGCGPPGSGLRVAWAMTTPIALNSPFFVMPAAETACRAAAIEVPWTITDVVPVRLVELVGEEVGDVGRAAGGGLSGGRRGAAGGEGGRGRQDAGRGGEQGLETHVVLPRGLSRSVPTTEPRVTPAPRSRGRVSRPTGWSPMREDNGGMTELPRKAAARTARLAALPAGLRRTPGDGLRQAARRQARRGRAVRGPAAHRRAALPHAGRAQGRGDEVRPGAERPGVRAARGAGRALPRAPHRAAGLRSADADRDRAPAARPRTSATTGASGWSGSTARPPRPPRSARSTAAGGATEDGATERDVAVKVQYPGAGEALMGDLRQIARVARGVAPVFPGLDIKPLVDELQARAADELDYHLEAEAQAAYAEAFADHPDIVVPAVVAVGERGAGHRVDGLPPTRWPTSSARGPRRSATTTASSSCRFLFEGPRRTGHAPRRPAPRQLPRSCPRRRRPRPARGARLRRGRPARPSGGCPAAWGG